MDAGAFPINARLLAPEDVARSFVAPPRAYELVRSLNHVVVFGPRGSGKTTLLSMLTQPAQRVWHQQQGAKNPDLSYIGALVRADLTWSRQLRVLARNTSSADADRTIQAVYADHCVISILRYLRDYLRHEHTDKLTEAGGRAAVENLLSQRLADACDLESDFSFTDLKTQLLRRIHGEWRRARTGADFDRPSVGLGEIFTIASIAASTLGEVGLTHSIALLLDELELLPRYVRDHLVEGLRDADNSVLLKMSLSPIEGATERFFASIPASGQDFVSVDLTYAQKTRGYPFTDALITDLARRSGEAPANALNVLGRSRFDLASTAHARAASYGPRGDISRAFVGLAKTDTSFNRYLVKHGIDPSNPGDLGSTDRAMFVRKVRDLVLVRHQYRIANEKQRQRRMSAKSLAFYAGHQSVLALLEGNPRWIVNFMSAALEERPSLPLRPVR